MARKAQEIKAIKLKIKSKYSSRVKNRCPLCGRGRAYIRYFDMCRICFRELAHKGDIPGVVKSSW